MSTSKTVRQQIWARLKDVALPDSRFHLNFAEVIPDFEGSEAATDACLGHAGLRDMPQFAFVTPDNCLVELRRRMHRGGKPFVMSTYGIYRGFRLRRARHGADRARNSTPPGSTGSSISAGRSAWRRSPREAASISWSRARRRCRWTACASARATVSSTSNGACSPTSASRTRATPVVAVVHDVQVVEEKLFASPTDILVDSIATPTRLIDVEAAAQPPARHQLGPARAASRSPTPRRCRNLRACTAWRLIVYATRGDLTMTLSDRSPILLGAGSRRRARRLGWPVTPGRRTPLVFQASWINDAEFAGYFVAIDKGYYKEEGLDLEYLPGGPDVDPGEHDHRRQGRRDPDDARHHDHGDRRPGRQVQDHRRAVSEEPARHRLARLEADPNPEGPGRQDAGRAAGQRRSRSKRC